VFRGKYLKCTHLCQTFEASHTLHGMNADLCTNPTDGAQTMKKQQSIPITRSWLDDIWWVLWNWPVLFWILDSIFSTFLSTNSAVNVKKNDKCLLVMRNMLIRQSCQSARLIWPRSWNLMSLHKIFAKWRCLFLKLLSNTCSKMVLRYV
jgi:hypothetical protein